MKLRLDRTKMIGGGNAYDVYVRRSEALCPDEMTHYTILDSDYGNPWVSVCDAIKPASHWAMPTGFERWDDHKRYDSQAEAIKLRALKAEFTELADCDRLPALWRQETSLPSVTCYLEIEP